MSHAILRKGDFWTLEGQIIWSLWRVQEVPLVSRAAMSSWRSRRPINQRALQSEIMTLKRVWFLNPRPLFQSAPSPKINACFPLHVVVFKNEMNADLFPWRNYSSQHTFSSLPHRIVSRLDLEWRFVSLFILDPVRPLRGGAPVVAWFIIEKTFQNNVWRKKGQKRPLSFRQTSVSSLTLHHGSKYVTCFLPLFVFVSGGNSAWFF